MNILIVDDSKTMRLMIKKAIGDAGFKGHKYLEAGNAMDALKILEDQPVNLIISDWNMPRMSGVEFIKTVSEKGYTIPFGFITSENSTKQLEQTQALGAEFHITKPFTPEKIERCLKPFLA